MRYSCALLMVLLLAGCNRVQSPQLVVAANQNAAQQPIDIPGEVVGDFVIGEALHYGKLTVFPISSRTAKTADRFMTLDEGLASGDVEICEIGSATEAEGESPAAEEQLADAPAADDDPFGPDNAVPDADDPFRDSASNATPVAAAADDPFGEDQPAEAPITMVRDPDDPFGAPADDSNQQSSTNETSPDFEELTELISSTVQASGFEGGEDEVNRLVFINHSDRPLYLMPGELIVGGNQDRTIARETLVPPGGKRVAVEVFCVEHGRWHQHTAEELQETVVAAYGGMSSDSGLAVSVSPDLVAEASGNSTQERARLQTVDLKSRGKFVASLGSVSSDARRAVQEANDQSAVWERVAQENQRSGADSETGAFTANYLDQEIIQALAPYMKELGSTVADRPQVVGVLVAVGGEIKTVDVFESTPLFQKMWPKLLKSFAFDALNAEELAAEEAGETGVEKTVVAKSDLPTMADARRCLELATQSEVQEVKTADGLTMTRREANEMVSFSVHDEESAAMMGGMGGGFGGAMHGGGFF